MKLTKENIREQRLVICPKCCGPCYEGAAICFSCLSVIDWKQELLLQLPGILLWTVIFGSVVFAGYWLIYR